MGEKTIKTIKKNQLFNIISTRCFCYAIHYNDISNKIIIDNANYSAYVILTFVPSVKFVKQTTLQTSSCQIMVQKSAIVLGFGPYNEQ